MALLWHFGFTLCVGIYRPAGDNMNGEYTIANARFGNFSTRSADYTGGVEYFDVYSPLIKSRYSQVYWTMMDSVPLPSDIVERFDGKVMAVTGMEADQVMRSPGKPDVSVPITWAYNHHYGQYLNGENSVMEQIELASFNARANIMGHAMPGNKVWTTRPKDDDPNPTSKIPTSTVFATGNGGEYRKSFHSYPAPYAQLLESPQSWRIQPMQIDTKNRDGSMAAPGMPFKPGPYPTSAQAPRSGPDAVYSGLLECPCTDRITRSLGSSGGQPSAKLSAKCIHPVGMESDCRDAAAALAAKVTQILPNGSLPSCQFTEHSGTFLAGYAPGSSATGWTDLPTAQAWCCEHQGCGGVTFQDGVYTARAGGTATPYPMKGLVSWVAGSATPFEFRAGASGSLPVGCSLEISPSSVSGFFNSNVSSDVACGGAVGRRHVAGAGDTGNVSMTLELNETANQVTITLSGPSSVWFGVGFDAGAMSDLPYAIVVDGSGNISERKLANHAPGQVLQPTVALVSASTTHNRRTVTLRRALKLSDYESDYYNFDVALASLPYITAVGSGPTFGFHKSSSSSSLALFSRTGPTCVCAGTPPPFGHTAEGQVLYSAAGAPDGGDTKITFGKRCVAFCDPKTDPTCTRSADLLSQRNPTCDVRAYKGGLSCCHHLYYLLDKNQSIPDEQLVYQMKMRFYFQEYNPNWHKRLYRWHWQTAMGAGEYDIPKCKEGTPPELCVHTIRARLRVSDFANGPCNYRSGLNVLTPECKPGSVGFKPIFLGGHCHAPSCISMELFNADTGELLCRNVPTYGTRKSNATAGHRFDEDGYLALPPCVWGDPAQGLNEPPLLTWNTNLSAVKKCNSTYGHTGEMARWQGHGVIV